MTDVRVIFARRYRGGVFILSFSTPTFSRLLKWCRQWDVRPRSSVPKTDALTTTLCLLKLFSPLHQSKPASFTPAVLRLRGLLVWTAGKASGSVSATLAPLDYRAKCGRRRPAFRHGTAKVVGAVGNAPTLSPKAGRFTVACIACLPRAGKRTELVAGLSQPALCLRRQPCGLTGVESAKLIRRKSLKPTQGLRTFGYSAIASRRQQTTSLWLDSRCFALRSGWPTLEERSFTYSCFTSATASSSLAAHVLGNNTQYSVTKWEQGAELNDLPSGYEPDELPMLHPAIKLIFVQ